MRCTCPLCSGPSNFAHVIFSSCFLQQTCVRSSSLDCRHLSVGLARSFSALIKLSHIPCETFPHFEPQCAQVYRMGCVVTPFPPSSATMTAISKNLKPFAVHFLSHMCTAQRGSLTALGTKLSSSMSSSSSALHLLLHTARQRRCWDVSLRLRRLYPYSCSLLQRRPDLAGRISDPPPHLFGELPSRFRQKGITLNLGASRPPTTTTLSLPISTSVLLLSLNSSFITCFFLQQVNFTHRDPLIQVPDSPGISFL